MKLKIEEGKYYINGSGRVYGPMERAENDLFYPMLFAGRRWSETGISKSGNIERRLVEEVFITRGSVVDQRLLRQAKANGDARLRSMAEPAKTDSAQGYPSLDEIKQRAKQIVDEKFEELFPKAVQVALNEVWSKPVDYPGAGVKPFVEIPPRFSNARRFADGGLVDLPTETPLDPLIEAMEAKYRPKKGELDLCEDEGCEHHGTPHVCVSARAAEDIEALKLVKMHEDRVLPYKDLPESLTDREKTILSWWQPSHGLRAAIENYRKVKADFDSFDGDRRGIAHALGEAEAAVMRLLADDDGDGPDCFLAGILVEYADKLISKTKKESSNGNSE